MTERNRDIRLGGEDNRDIVKLDKNGPALKRAHEVTAKAVIKERLAMKAKIRARALQDSEVGETASGSWGEMPRMAREHEASLVDGDPALEAAETEFDDYGGVTAC
jgi:hypothetical protein